MDKELQEKMAKRRETAKSMLKQTAMEFVNFRKLTQKFDKFSAHFADSDDEKNNF